MKKYIFILLLIVLILQGCEDYLDVKPSKSIVVLSTIEDYQSLLDGIPLGMNYVPALQVLCADNVVIDEIGWNSLSSNEERNAYIWNDVVYENDVVTEWYYAYKQVFNANLVLEGFDDLEGAYTITEKERLEGSALFYRANAFYHMLEMFSAPYDATTAASAPGIPLRTSSNINDKFKRASVEECYSLIINDLNKAAGLLPESVDYKSRPSKGAALALLSRIHLIRGEYELAEEFAVKTLELEFPLYDFSALDPMVTYPMLSFGSEMIFYNELTFYSFFFNPFVQINPELYEMYENGDLRKIIFFFDTGAGVTFRGHYTGNYAGFGGLAIDEVYLTLAEAKVRKGDVQEGIEILNQLLETRWAPGEFTPWTSSDSQSALDVVLQERRKELVFRGSRWSDLRRLNKDELYAKTLSRSLNGEEYILVPGDPRYTFLIPQDEVRLNGLEQNER